MVRPLVFKGEKKSKKRKTRTNDDHHILGESGINTLTTPSRNDTDDGDDSWVSAESSSDITGPIIFALPSSPPSCITCDANGKVFLSNIENIVDGNLTTAEPDDLRQVWVASRLAGAEGISFKGHHGRYLSCDKFGIFTALHEAISSEEVFTCISNDSIAGAFSIQTEREKFIAISENTEDPKLRGDAESILSGATFHIQMQARFKPKLVIGKEIKAREKISAKELEDVVGRRLESSEVRRLKKARVEGNYHEMVLDIKVKKKHDKYA